METNSCESDELTQERTGGHVDADSQMEGHGCVFDGADAHKHGSGTS